MLIADYYVLTMKVTEKDVSYVADLANLELTDQERQRMLKDLNSILDYIDRLNELDTSNVPPMAQVSGTFASGDQSGRFARRCVASMLATRRGNEECSGNGWRVL